jgi:type I site-specific restriction endonuclease
MKLYIINQKKRWRMTQEELDALLNSGVDLDSLEDDTEQTQETSDTQDVESEPNENKEDDDVMPPPADDKHKVVAQLDEVTKESEEKASEVLNIVMEISDDIEKRNGEFEKIKAFLEEEKAFIEKLHNKFPHIKAFKERLDKIQEQIENVQASIDSVHEIQDKIMNVMEIMQYQDIHRQKIERVINIMRALIKYMNKLFEGKVGDEERVQSADFIHGDSAEVVSEDDIEELLKQFGG